MWRPDDWKPLDNPDLTSVYEAGADTMLNALLDELDICWNDNDRLIKINQMLWERDKEEQNGTN